MCFSAEASFTASALLGIAGVATLMKVSSPTQRAIATMPLLFSIQQAMEGLVWIGLNTNNVSLVTYGSYAFIFFASVIWPLWVPSVVRLFDPQRSRFFIPSFIAGILNAAWFFIGIVPQGINVSAINCNIVYYVAIHQQYIWFESALYLLATVVPFFIVHDRTLRAIGVLLIASYITTYLFYIHAFISVWCFAAAILSIMAIIVATRYPRIRR